MESTITIALTPEGNLELPPEIREKFANGEQYSVLTTEDSIIFKKNPISSSSIKNNHLPLIPEQPYAYYADPEEPAIPSEDWNMENEDQGIL
ncbi:hypothetical protein PJF56_01435 [Roseofilum sp. BLCC_M91]|uniref:SpoVT-AbrB domain-containing protein n=1 Tax=Roseofilum halophilum BLCC-M91 TaxID=3022259 RepID=A0ABT7BEK7_9CYAN|nr:hypothetical protein [Roseofilum halophilum]MDJ1177515.1 hypothetical protein [Roseofilum halophilum BLCC-M91]